MATGVKVANSTTPLKVTASVSAFSPTNKPVPTSDNWIIQPWAPSNAACCAGLKSMTLVTSFGRTPEVVPSGLWGPGRLRYYWDFCHKYGLEPRQREFSTV